VRLCPCVWVYVQFPPPFFFFFFLLWIFSPYPIVSILVPNQNDYFLSWRWVRAPPPPQCSKSSQTTSDLHHFHFSYIGIADIYGEISYADARSRRSPQWDQAASVSAVSQVVLVQSSISPTHPRSHGRKALPLLLLRPSLQAAQPRPATHATPHR